jgi:DNA-binding Lrp family transcriptional regulator
MRGRKSGNPIKAITSNDKELFKALSRTGYVSKEQAQNLIDLNERRLKNLEKDGYIKSTTAIIKNKQINVYQLNDKGKKYVANNISSVNNFYKATSPQHDLVLADRYLKLDDESKDYWKTEGDIRKIFSSQITESMSMPDALIIKHSIEMGTEVNISAVEVIEVITSNYGHEEIDAKIEFITQVLQIAKEEVSFERAN